MNRLPDWSRRLDLYVAAAQKREFAWGALDCAMFAAGAVQAVTGVDLAEKWRGAYHDAFGAGLLVGRAGGIEQLAGKELELHGCQPVDPSRAQRGDIGVVDVSEVRRRFEAARALGVCGSVGFLVPLERQGMRVFPFSAVLRAWSI